MYKLVFDIENSLSFPLFSILAFIVSAVVLVLYWLRYSNDINDKFKRNFIYIFMIFTTLFFGVVSIEKIKIYYLVKDAIQNNKYKSIEGKITHFKVAPYSGHKEESFIVADKNFSYSDYDDTVFYHITKSHGGFIRNEHESVKIDYLSFSYNTCLPLVKYFGYSCPELKKNKIIRLWIKR